MLIYPTKFDSDENGVNDSSEDFDSDSLINIQEYYNGTEPYNKDTDKYGLSDGNEVNIYGTDLLRTMLKTEFDYCMMMLEIE